jgi:hypothetical protein
MRTGGIPILGTPHMALSENVLQKGWEDLSGEWFRVVQSHPGSQIAATWFFRLIRQHGGRQGTVWTLSTHTHTFAWHIHRRNVFASDSWIWVTIAMSMLPVKFAASYAMWLVLHSQSLSYIHMIHIFLHKPFWNVITGRPQLPAEKNLSFRSPGWNS